MRRPGRARLPPRAGHDTIPGRGGKRRHLLRGLVAGVLIGLALAIFSFVYGINALGVATPAAALVLGILIGIVMVYMPSRKRDAGVVTVLTSP